LNQLADYLGVKRQYLWQLAGLLKDMDYSEDTMFSDPRLKFHFAQADKLPNPVRNLLVEIMKTITDYFQSPKPPETITAYFQSPKPPETVPDE